MAISAAFKQTFSCVASIYRQDERDRDGDGNSLGLRLVNTTPEACKRHATDNYDKETAVGMLKSENIFTADKIHFRLGANVADSDWLQVTEPDSSVWWLEVRGAPKVRTLLGYQRVYAIPDVQPVIVLDGSGNPKIYGA